MVKEVGTSTLFEVDVVAHQEIEVHAVFNLNGESCTTGKVKVTLLEKLVMMMKSSL